MPPRPAPAPSAPPSAPPPRGVDHLGRPPDRRRDDGVPQAIASSSTSRSLPADARRVASRRYSTLSSSCFRHGEKRTRSPTPRGRRSSRSRGYRTSRPYDHSVNPGRSRSASIASGDLSGGWRGPPRGARSREHPAADGPRCSRPLERSRSTPWRTPAHSPLWSSHAPQQRQLWSASQTVVIRGTVPPPRGAPARHPNFGYVITSSPITDITTGLPNAAQESSRRTPSG